MLVSQSEWGLDLSNESLDCLLGFGSNLHGLDELFVLQFTEQFLDICDLILTHRLIDLGSQLLVLLRLVLLLQMSILVDGKEALVL